MSYRITCPYCFKTMSDKEVWFRSERVNQGENDFLPEDYDDKEDFIARYHGADKEEILKKIADWEFFEAKEDTREGGYEDFWRNFGGTTEDNPADEVLGVKAYRRPLIDPHNFYHRSFLKPQTDGSWLIRDGDGMVTAIELNTGERCNRRVCRHCHNPLPDNYGKSPVKFASIIGITGAGKTVYLSQLLRNMRSYCAKVGLSAYVKASSTVTFLEKNPIRVNAALPGSTPANRLQQPLFYELVHTDRLGNNVTDTFVLYDVAGEIFDAKYASLIPRFAPFLEHSDGLVVLIDPMQFETISSNVDSGQELTDPEEALGALHGVVSGSVNEACNIPCAVCISKIDMDAVQDVLSTDLQNRLQEDVVGMRGPNRLFLPLFNAKQYNPIVRELDRWITDTVPELAQTISTDYKSFSYFAFTALGCNVVTREIDGTLVQCPEGPIEPHRMEEPLLWLFNRLGYIEANERLFDPAKEIVKCPECGMDDTDELPEGSYKEEGRFLRKKKIPVNRCCNKCGYRWMHIYEYQG